MPTLELTADQHDRLAKLRDELATVHAGSYASVTVSDTMAYLLDLAETVEDPDRCVKIESATETPATDHEFPRTELESTLSERHRRHSKSSADAPMDLYSIAETYDITGRSNMTKQELITAISDAVEQRYTDPVAPIDLSWPLSTEAESDSATNEAAAETATSAESPPSATPEPPDSDTQSRDSDNEQLNTMLNLLETHQDKWQEASGDARYEVDLPDGSVEQVRTKDDVRAALFRHY
jgi:hypothetical protein